MAIFLAMDGLDWTDILALVLTVIGVISAVCANNGGPPEGGGESGA